MRNFNPDRWPTGAIEGKNPEYDFSTQPWPTEPGAFSFNIDPSPSKQFLRLNRTNEATRSFGRLSFDLPPEFELFDLSEDPEQLRNVAASSDYADTLQRLKEQLEDELIRNADPRVMAEIRGG